MPDLYYITVLRGRGHFSRGLYSPDGVVDLPTANALMRRLESAGLQPRVYAASDAGDITLRDQAQDLRALNALRSQIRLVMAQREDLLASLGTIQAAIVSLGDSHPLAKPTLRYLDDTLRRVREQALAVPQSVFASWHPEPLAYIRGALIAGLALAKQPGVTAIDAAAFEAQASAALTLLGPDLYAGDAGDTPAGISALPEPEASSDAP